MDASTLTVGEFLGTLFPGRDSAGAWKRVEAFAGTLVALIDRISPMIERVVVSGCAMVERIDKLPPVPGYEPYFIEVGQPPLMARMTSYFLVRASDATANELKLQRTVMDALRYLAKPGRTKRAISRRLAVLLEASETSILAKAFDLVDVSMFEFVGALEAATGGDCAAIQRVTEIAALLGPTTFCSQGAESQPSKHCTRAGANIDERSQGSTHTTLRLKTIQTR